MTKTPAGCFALNHKCKSDYLPLTFDAQDEYLFLKPSFYPNMLDDIGFCVQYCYGRRMGMSQGTGINQPLLADSLIGCLVGMTNANITDRVVSQQLPDYSAIVAMGYSEALTVVKRDDNFVRIEVYPGLFSRGSKTVNVPVHIACNRVARQVSFSKGNDAIFTSYIAAMDDNFRPTGD